MQKAWMVLTLAVVLGACGRKETAPQGTETMPAETTTAAVTPAPMPAAPESAAAAPGAMTDPQIVAVVMGANSADSAAGAMATTKGTSTEVKQFGKQMVTDHGAANKQLMELTKKLNIMPEQNATSQKMAADAQAEMQKQQGLTGTAYDREYIDHEVTLHQQVLDALDKTLIPAAQNAELKALLEKIRGVVSAHLDHAKQVQGTLGTR